jgi:hypothetical protein
VSTDEAIERQLRAGRLIREASSSGFPDAAGLTLVPDLPASKSGGKPKVAMRTTARREPRDAAAEAATAEREREAQRRADLAARESARTDAEAADAAADRARARVEELEGELEVARRELTEAHARSRKARSTLRDLR